MASFINKNEMKRTARVYLNDLNTGKSQIVRQFLYQCHDVMQYFVDLFWQRKDFSGKLADAATVHRAKERFNITTRLGQALAKQASECVRSQHKRNRKRKPQLKWHTVTLFYHFVTIEPFTGKGFNWCVKLIGSGAPKLVIPIKSTKVINQRISDDRTLVQLLERKCEEEGIQLVVKDPRYTSQFCSACNRWDRRNRKGDKFKCVHCGYLAHADHNAARNLELLGVAGVYSLRSYLSSKCQSFG